jgi:hypothetical protein
VPRLARMICAFLLGYPTGEITGGLPGTSPAGSAHAWAEREAAGAAEFDADLDDLVRMVEVAVRVG